MTENQQAHFKEMLLQQKAQYETERDSYRGTEMSDTEEQEAGDSADYDPNDPADEASNLFDRERNRMALDNVTTLLQKIDRALAKMEEGTYGLSDVDGAPIPLDRLEALPYALTTINQEETL